MSESSQTVVYDPFQSTSPLTPWFSDPNTVLMVALVIAAVCGFIAALVARHNGRTISLAFLTGFFFGPLGIMTHMIMGEASSTRGKH